MKGNLILVYTKYVPYNNRERFKTAIRTFGGECDFTLEEVDADSERGKRLVESYNGASPNLIGFYPPNDYHIALNPTKSGSFIFPNDSEFQNFFSIYGKAGDDFDEGLTAKEVISKGQAEATAWNDEESVSNKFAKMINAPVESVQKGLKVVGGCLIGCAVGGAYLYYKAHQTNLTVNVNGRKKKYKR